MLSWVELGGTVWNWGVELVGAWVELGRGWWNWEGVRGTGDVYMELKAETGTGWELAGQFQPRAGPVPSLHGA